MFWHLHTVSLDLSAELCSWSGGMYGSVAVGQFLGDHWAVREAFHLRLNEIEFIDHGCHFCT